MKSVFTAAIIGALALGHVILPVLAGDYEGQDPNDPTSGISPLPAETTDHGCYSSPGNAKEQGVYTFQSQGWCQDWCVRNSFPIMALFNGSDCYCGSALPSDTDKTDSSKCGTGCNGWPAQDCGGPDGYHFFDAGLVGKSSPSSNTPSSATTSSSASVVSVENTVFVTAPGSTSPSIVYTTSAASSTNKAAIAGGVVVGVVALLAIAGGAFFFIRRQKRNALEEDRRRMETMANFVNKGEKSPSSSSINDTRLEPSVMFQRRQSDGSIADNQDYSRRILKVTNPDYR